MSDWGGFWVAMAMLFIAFSASDCHDADSIAQAIVKHMAMPVTHKEQ